MTGSEAPSAFRLAYVPGVTPAKWVRIWNERFSGIPLTLVAVSADEAFGLLRSGGADAGFVRLPVDRTDLSAIPLYTETTVVMVPKDHIVAAVEQVSTEDLADDIVLHPLDDTLDWERLPGKPALERPATTEDAVELVAAGIGVLVVPQSLARLHHRKDLTYRTVTDAPESRVALSWPEEKTTDQVEDFIGIVRGRTVNSTRGRSQTPAADGQKAKSKAKATPQRSDAGGGARRKSTAGKAGGKNPRGSGSGGPKGGAKRGKPRRHS
ncbi:MULTISPECIES: LysR family transcriptional regulator substrate-binding protein [unclassified Streptomyces]|uniref:LysR family transcriptional regulator substrate-binding protein n=1 Tax=unclassified Streptomyces TaxID=2593676 RepID=UPI002E803980|nr:LysR family transcriptional regulator substrate-binding protein [Streptomyces sp. NBC_00589]WTI40610.1 LysR family transcriptional regulator substrate-binding protein [Streptomyces sp. NBC_00775]WUB25706.1 LysR family transcriptional regulator substrate-binding protein [Streptomyces sp. NBC_00589]